MEGATDIVQIKNTEYTAKSHETMITISEN